jgi:hypothetical protein
VVQDVLQIMQVAVLQTDRSGVQDAANKNFDSKCTRIYDKYVLQETTLAYTLIVLKEASEPFH